MSRDRSAIPRATEQRAARIADVTSHQLEDQYRVTDSARTSPWWFSSRSDREDEAGRFDLLRPRGSCYFSDDPLGALYERLTDPDDLEAAVPASVLERLSVWEVAPPPPASVADTTAVPGGLPKEFGAGHEYRTCWAWADLLDELDRGGVRTWSRMAPHETRTMVVFGPNGLDALTPVGTVLPATRWRTALLADALVLDEPTLAELTSAHHPDAAP